MEDIKPPTPPTNTPEPQTFTPQPPAPQAPEPQPVVAQQPVTPQPMTPEQPQAPEPLSDNPVPVESTGEITTSAAPSATTEFPAAAPLTTGETKKSKKKAILVVIVCVVALLGIAVALYFTVLKKDGNAPIVGGENVPTGKVATNLEWKAPATIDKAKWTPVATSEPGDFIYQLVGTKCTVLFQQPSGLKAKGVTSINRVLDDGITFLAGEFAKSSKVYSAVTAESVVIPGMAEKETFTFNAKSVTYTTTSVKAEVIAFQSGDYALIAMPVCPLDQFDANLVSQMIPFIKSYKVDATY